MTNHIHSIFFYEISGFPIIIIWLLAACLFFTIKLGFVNLRLFPHSLTLLFGRKKGGNSRSNKGEISPIQALMTTLSATVGLGNIAGVAIGISIGGPGTVPWMMICGFLSMSLKFAEVTAAHKYRRFSSDQTLGGPFWYIRQGFEKINLAIVGKILAVIYGICLFASSIGGGSIFQSNQTVAILEHNLPVLNDRAILAFLVAAMISIITFGGIKRIALISSFILPFMSILYVLSVIIILFSYSEQLKNSLILMFHDAFNFRAAEGGAFYAMVVGFRRGLFSNLAGLGISGITHAAAKTKEPVHQGCMGLLEPFIDTVVICSITGLAVVTSGAYLNNDLAQAELGGILLVNQAFASVGSWFTIFLTISVFLFATSTIMAVSYHAEVAWRYLFGVKFIWICRIIFALSIYFGGVLELNNSLLDFIDFCVLSLALPNILSLYLINNDIHSELKLYISKYIKH
jgi:AGCS family alanine or glycine:cation symporter